MNLKFPPNHNSKRILYALLIAGIFLLFYVACKDKKPMQDLPEYVNQIKNQQNGLPKKENSLTLEPPPAQYQAHAFRTPFGEDTAANKTANVSESPPLQSYGLNVLRFVGTLSHHSQFSAYILAPDGIVYQAKVGDKLGNRQGKIISIQPGALVVQEMINEKGNSTIQQTVTLKLKEEHE